MNKVKIKKILAVIFPIVMISTWISTQAYDLLVGTVVELPIRGYDPRDLLSGHYAIYDVLYGNKAVCPTRKKISHSACVCLEKSGKDNLFQGSWLGSCSAKPQECRLFLKGTCENKRFKAGIERFYFSEVHKEVLRVVPEGSTIIVSVSSQGKALVKDLVIGKGTE